MGMFSWNVMFLGSLAGGNVVIALFMFSKKRFQVALPGRVSAIAEVAIDWLSGS